MAKSGSELEGSIEFAPHVRIAAFSIAGLFGNLSHNLKFPIPTEGKAEPTIMILSGQNGTGKTTLLSMIGGILELDFDEFRRVPFSSASLLFSTGQRLHIRKTSDENYPIEVKFGDRVALLARDKSAANYSKDQQVDIAAFRESARTVLGAVNYEFLKVNRSVRPISPHIELFEDENARMVRAREERPRILSLKVVKFLREAQLNHSKFFQAEELELLPRILERLNSSSTPSGVEQLVARLKEIKNKVSSMKRFGLQTDDADLEALYNVLAPPNILSEQSLAVVQTYVEIQERKDRARELIASRLIQFEAIMDEFLFQKRVRIDPLTGILIHGSSGLISENDLSSGEYHFLYMMVSALLCERIGSVIAIDEPELSLHVKWQRKLISALTKCASGASPLFFFATHSTAISAEHADKVHAITAVE